MQNVKLVFNNLIISIIKFTANSLQFTEKIMKITLILLEKPAPNWCGL